MSSARGSSAQSRNSVAHISVTHGSHVCENLPVPMSKPWFKTRMHDRSYVTRTVRHRLSTRCRSDARRRVGGLGSDPGPPKKAPGRATASVWTGQRIRRATAAKRTPSDSSHPLRVDRVSGSGQLDETAQTRQRRQRAELRLERNTGARERTAQNAHLGFCSPPTQTPTLTWLNGNLHPA